MSVPPSTKVSRTRFNLPPSRRNSDDRNIGWKSCSPDQKYKISGSSILNRSLRDLTFSGKKPLARLKPKLNADESISPDTPESLESTQSSAKYLTDLEFETTSENETDEPVIIDNIKIKKNTETEISEIKSGSRKSSEFAEVVDNEEEENNDFNYEYTINNDLDADEKLKDNQCNVNELNDNSEDGSKIMESNSMEEHEDTNEMKSMENTSMEDEMEMESVKENSFINQFPESAKEPMGEDGLEHDDSYSDISDTSDDLRLSDVTSVEDADILNPSLLDHFGAVIEMEKEIDFVGTNHKEELEIFTQGVVEQTEEKVNVPLKQKDSSEDYPEIDPSQVVMINQNIQVDHADVLLNPFPLPPVTLEAAMEDIISKIKTRTSLQEHREPFTNGFDFASFNWKPDSEFFQFGKEIKAQDAAENEVRIFNSNPKYDTVKRRSLPKNLRFGIKQRTKGFDNIKVQKI